jgi:very-short-patch-repair endonuclease
MGRKVRPHGQLASVAARQHGVVSQCQLSELGYSEGSVLKAALSGRLHRVHRGVYAVGHPGLTRAGRCLAAVLACGDGALLSHKSAAWLWGLGLEFSAEPEITTPIRGHARAGMQLHHSTILEEADCAIEDGVPVTAVPRTLLDVAATMPSRSLAHIAERAQLRGLLDLGAADDLLSRAGRHRGRKPLRKALSLYLDPAMTRSATERAFLALVKRTGLPRPSMNHFLAGHEIDAYWEAERFAVEIDGYSTHRSRAAFERDPVRIEQLKLAGIDTIRITARRIERDPESVANSLRALLGQRRRALGQSSPKKERS